jgi:hypothetical protein
MARKIEPYSPKETKERFKAVILGARLAGHKPMESLIKKKSKTKKVAKKKRRMARNEDHKGD